LGLLFFFMRINIKTGLRQESFVSIFHFTLRDGSIDLPVMYNQIIF
jgi:hypothetical protein